MGLPNGHGATIDAEKVRDYLLSFEHPVGRFKARLFHAFGYGRDDWPRLQRDLSTAVRSGVARPGQASPYGRKWEVHGTLHGPSGASVGIVTVWIVRNGEEHPRFVTAFPEEGR
jgi:hypothetical protein